MATRSRLPSGSTRSHSRPASPSSSIHLYVKDIDAVSHEFEIPKVSGRASPVCSDR